MLKKLLFILGIVFLLVGAVFGVLKFRDVFFSEQPTDDTRQTNNAEDLPLPNGQQQPVQSQAFDKSKYPLDEPASPWWVVNKTRPLPKGYIPADLAVPNVRLRLSSKDEQMKYSQQATPDLLKMFDAATAEGITLVFGSGYRSEVLQRQFYNGYVTESGQEFADATSARPGYSEHQTGLSFDATNVSQTCHLEKCFAEQPEGTWLKANAYKYGFIIRYPEGKAPITGYDFEPWHMRWVGIELANEMHKQNIQTLEEFFNLPAAPDYL